MGKNAFDLVNPLVCESEDIKLSGLEQNDFASCSILGISFGVHKETMLIHGFS